MSKTAMQELIDKIQYSIDVQSGISLIETLTETQVNTLKAVMLVAERLLEKEKEQIIEAVNYGNRQDHYDATEVELSNYYYNQTYNQNK
jgi:phenylacetate-coenzyme A ligase PaaK-like adenylate-forming protein